jgi:hypothetical protein
VDNFGGGGDTIEECFSHFFKFVVLCQKHNVKLNHGDTEIGATIVTTLGYEISYKRYGPGERLTNFESNRSHAAP